MKSRIWLSAPYWTGREEKYIQSAIRDNWIAPGGANVIEFEKRIASIAGRKYCKAVNSGTSALHLSLLTLGFGKGDTVFCPDFTFAAVINPVIYTGAEPVLVDCLPGSWNMDPEALREAIRRKDELKTAMDPYNRPKKGLIYLHNYGMPADTGTMEKIASTFGLHLVEDASEALGSRTGDHPVGRTGEVSTFSFNGNKIVTG